MASERHVIVAGGGIAGLTAALALARRGLRVTVLEQAARLEEIGAGIQLSPNATRVLIGLGLRERLEMRAIVPHAIRVMAGGAGRQIVRIPLGKTVEQSYAAPYWTMHRGDLQAGLLQAAEAGENISLKLGARIEDFAKDKGGVVVRSRTGSQIADAHGIALIGADGLWSRVRDRLRRERAPRFRHRTAWRALLPIHEAAPEWHEPFIHLWLGQDAHLVHYLVKGGALINIVAIVHDEWRGESWSAPGERGEIMRHFARWAWSEKARALVAAPERWQKWALHDRRGGTPNGSGAITLIGDAAHPMLPFLAQGAGMAIEDAAVLADMLANNLDNPRKALRAYERARRARTARAQKASRRQGRIYGLSGPEALIRNLAMRAMGGERLLARYDWLYKWQPPS
ncbi:MAG TPA: FAD-dependent oxidoreductase [Pseudolabrys sp.]|nr:FAD-dependent oxidoreductase [Pseudolabrys sp.]